MEIRKSTVKNWILRQWEKGKSMQLKYLLMLELK